MLKLNEIMIVDDDDISNFITQKCLENSGTVERITVYQDSPVAINELIEKRKKNTELPEYILLDINMPYIDGFDFLDLCESSNLHEGLNVIMYTSSLRQEDRKKASTYSSVKGYLEKPLQMEALRAIVNK
ncbi:MAG: response regulator receiver protein [Chitinophagaceae bacterium]|jgi:CheY-like chemotaxis protein|nr:response regulator receiver protein [Chitinophagaceae bacterium]